MLHDRVAKVRERITTATGFRGNSGMDKAVGRAGRVWHGGCPSLRVTPSKAYNDVMKYGFLRAIRPMRVLVVDDVHDHALMQGLLIKRMGHQVQLAHDGQDALARGNLLQPEVVFLDIGLPDMDGCTVCGLMRQQPWGMAALMIAVTGRNDQVDVERSLRSGFDHHVVKPMDFHTLQDFLEEAEVKTRVTPLDPDDGAASSD